MPDEVRQLWTPYHSSGDEESSSDEESSDSSGASSTPEKITPLATLCNAIDVMESGLPSDDNAKSIAADEKSTQWTHYERFSSSSSSSEKNSPNHLRYNAADVSHCFTWDDCHSDNEQSYYNSLCSSSSKKIRSNEFGYDKTNTYSFDSRSTSSSKHISANATLYNAIEALEDDTIHNASTIVANFFSLYHDDPQYIQANLDYCDVRNSSNNIFHLLITKQSDSVFPALQKILQYDSNLISHTNDELLTPFSIAITYNASVYMLRWLYEKCPDNAEVPNSVGAFPEDMLHGLYPYSFLKEELPKDLLFRIHIAARIGCHTGLLKLLLDAKPNDIPVVADHEGKLPIHYACEVADEKNIENVLLLSKFFGGFMDVKDNNGYTPRCYLQIATNFVDTDGKNILHKWAKHNDMCSMDALKLLNDINASAFFLQDKHGFLPLHYLAMNFKSSVTVLFQAIQMYPASLLMQPDITADFIVDSFFDTKPFAKPSADDETASVTDVKDLYNFETIYSPIENTSAPVKQYDTMIPETPNGKKISIQKKPPIANPYLKTTKKRTHLSPPNTSIGGDLLPNNGAAIEGISSFVDPTIAKNNESTKVSSEKIELQHEEIDEYDPDGIYTEIFCALVDESTDSSKTPTVQQDDTTTMAKPSFAKKVPIENPYANPKKKRAVITPASGSSILGKLPTNEKSNNGSQTSASKVLDAVFQQATYVPTPIRDVQESNANTVKITGRVTWKMTGIFHQLGKKTEGRYFIVYVTDKNHDSICIKAFDAEYTKFLDKVMHGGVYTFSAMIADTSNKRNYNSKNPPTNPTVLKITKDTVIARLIDTSGFPSPPITPVKIIDLQHLKRNDMVDIVAVISQMGPTRTIMSKMRSTGNITDRIIRELQLSDSTGFVKLTLFDEIARAAETVYKIGNIIAVPQLKVTHYNGEICLSHCGKPIGLNPIDIPEATAVADWWKTHDKTIIGHNVRVSMTK